MRITLRRKQRWFHAVAITCLSGFALCGCARGTRDLSSNLQKTAEQEALDAERHVAERKQQDAESTASKILKERDFEEQTVAVGRKSKPADDPWAEEVVPEGPQQEEETLSADEDDVIRTVSGTDSLDNRLGDSETETAEELFEQTEETSDEVAEGETSVTDDSEGLVRIQKKPVPTPPAAAQRSRSANTMATARSGQASYRGTQEHPWSRKAPVIQRSEEESSVTQSEQPQAETRTESPMEESDKQVEAKARIQVLVGQAKSLLKKGESRSAYRAAQVAQRMAESNDVYFAAGEEQPADVVRAILSEVRSQEARVAAASKTVPPKQEPASQPETRKTPSNVVRKKAPSNLPEGWAFAEWQRGTAESSAAKTPEKPAAKQPAVAEMRIQPGMRRRSEANAFPKGSEWKPQPGTIEDQNAVAQSSATTADNRYSEVVPATDEAVSNRSDRHAFSNPSENQVRVPRPFPKPNLDEQPAAPPPPDIESTQLAVGSNWRTESLDTAGAGRMPLLVAPMPPQEPATDSLIEIAEEPLAVETDDLAKPASESKLWIMLAAAAGALATMFVRRRPAPVRVETKAP